MAYTSISDLLVEFSVPELAKLSGDPSSTTINESRINLFCDMAAVEIDVTLFALYSFPLENAPPIIKNISYELTVYFIYSSYYKNSEIPDQIKWRRINANSLLKMIKRGEILINADVPKSRIISRNTKEANEFDLVYLKDLAVV